MGFKALFNGKDLTGWTAKPGGWVVEDGTLYRKEKKAGYIWSKQAFGNFVLDLEFKYAPGCNSGIFIRTADPKNPVQTGLEIQVLDSHGKAAVGTHDCGAVYNCLAPCKNAAKPAGQWNHAVITAHKNKIQIELNGEQIIDMDLDQWTEPHQNPDGSKNKYNAPVKDFPRTGHIGFQDHGKPIWFRNVRIKVLG